MNSWSCTQRNDLSSKKLREAVQRLITLNSHRLAGESNEGIRRLRKARGRALKEVWGLLSDQKIPDLVE